MPDMMPQGAPSADPTAAAAPAPETAPDMSAGYVIEIRCTPDGKYAVGVEPLSEESQEEGGADAPGAPDGAASDDGEFQPVASIGEVLKLVREIAAHAGQMTDPAADMDAMSQGYGSNT